MVKNPKRSGIRFGWAAKEHSIYSGMNSVRLDSPLSPWLLPIMSTMSLAGSYLSLFKEFRLHPIRNERDYERALRVMDRLVVRDEADLDQGEADYLGALATLVEAYDREHFRIVGDRRKPHERLQYLMEQAGMTQAELAKVLGLSQPATSLICGGKRGLSRRNIQELAKHFRIDGGYFL
jgi:antitoxin component HigA of HigAB toxin-antitoxin module